MAQQTSTRSILSAKRNLAIGAILSGSLITLPAIAVQLGNGQIAFNYPPRLVRTTTSYKSPHTPATYYFTLAIPQNAGEPLGLEKQRSRSIHPCHLARQSQLPSKQREIPVEVFIYSA